MQRGDHEAGLPQDLDPLEKSDFRAMRQVMPKLYDDTPHMNAASAANRCKLTGRAKSELGLNALPPA